MGPGHGLVDRPWDMCRGIVCQWRFYKHWKPEPASHVNYSQGCGYAEDDFHTTGDLFCL
jgi:hypothetical protein